MRTPISSLPLILVILVLLVIFLLVRAGRGTRRPGRARIPTPPLPPPPPTPLLSPVRPMVNVSQLVLAIPLSPILVPLWALASIGDVIAAPILFVLGLLSAGLSLFFGLIGLDSPGMWGKTGRLFSRSIRSFLSIFGRLLSTFGFGGVVDRLARRPVPVAVPAPAANGTSAAGGFERTFPFEDDYRIESHLGSGGSTARLFVVRRVTNNRPIGDRLVLKYFDLDFGSRLEEIIRESRGMQLAKEMGIVLDHRLAEDHFYYVMPYYEGETLTRAAARIHRHLSASDEMPATDIRTCLTWMAEILRTLDGYHRHGVIHKDVKPDNVIVTEEGVRIVDLGLLTPLTSALTLTTHGTEYFRDPEMVKLALAGKRVKDVHAVRFDVYSAGAVLYYLLEGSFPACGPLSRFTRPVPMVLSWVVSRAMAEGDKRYPGMVAMRADLDAVLRLLDAGGLDDVPVSRLPSFSGFDAAAVVEPPPPPSLPSFTPPVAPARSVSPMRSVHRPRRGAGIAAMLIGLFVAFLVAVGVYAWRAEPPAPVSTPSPVPMTGERQHPGVRAFSVERLFDRVIQWTGEMAKAIPGMDEKDVRKIPLLLIVDGNEEVEFVAAAAERRLAERFPILRSAVARAVVREVLTKEPDVRPSRISSKLLDVLEKDTLPFVVWVRGRTTRPPRAVPGFWVDVRFYYRGFFRSTVMNGNRLDELVLEMKLERTD